MAERITGTDSTGERVFWDEARGEWKPLFEGSQVEAAGLGVREGLAQAAEGAQWLGEQVLPGGRLLGDAQRALMGETGGDMAADVIRSDEYDAARATYPQATGMGEAGVVAADIAAGAKGMGPALRAGGRGAVNVARKTRAGERIVDTISSSAERIRGRQPRSVGAAEVPIGQRERARPVLEGMATPDEMRARDFPLTPAQETVISTRNADEFNTARVADANAELDARSRGRLRRIGDATGMTDAPPEYGVVRQQQQQAVNRAVLEEMGDFDNVQAARATIGDQRGFLSDEFKDIYGSAEPVNIKTVDGLFDTLEDEIPVPDEVDRFIRRPLETLRKKADEGEMVSGEDLSALRNDLSARLQKAFKGDSNLDTAEALEEMIRRVDDLIAESLSETQLKSLATLRHRWQVGKALTEAGASTNARGDINLRSFINSYRRRNNLFKIGYDDSEFARFLDTAGAAMHKETPSSGTTEGLSAIAGDIAKDVVTGMVPGGGLLR